MKAFQLLADSTGYLGTPLPFSEAFTAVQTGVVDGVIGSGAEGYYSSFRDVTKYYIPHQYPFRGVVPDHERGPLQEAGRRPRRRRWTTSPSASSSAAGRPGRPTRPPTRRNWRTPGPRSWPSPRQEIANTAKKARAAVWPEILEDVGKEWGEKVLKAIVQ